MCFKGNGVCGGRAPGQGHSTPGVPELRGCGRFGELEERIQLEQKGQGKEGEDRTPHQGRKSQTVKGLVCNVRGFGLQPTTKRMGLGRFYVK